MSRSHNVFVGQAKVRAISSKILGRQDTGVYLILAAASGVPGTEPNGRIGISRVAPLGALGLGEAAAGSHAASGPFFLIPVGPFLEENIVASLRAI